MPPLISVVLPVYNTERYLHRAMDSILEQNFSDYELVVVDDGSTDSCPSILQEYVERYPGKVRVYRQENAGAYQAFNRSIELAEGKYILPFNSDDYYADDTLETLARCVREHNNVDVVFIHMASHQVDDNQNIINENFQPPSNAEFYLPTQQDVRENWHRIMLFGLVRNPMNLYRAELLKSHPFRTDWYGADYLMNCQIASSIHSAACSAKTLYQNMVYVSSKESQRNISHGKYYAYEHEMFNQFYTDYVDLFAGWGLLDSEKLKLLSHTRSMQFRVECANLNARNCPLDYEARCVCLTQTYFDDLVAQVGWRAGEVMNMETAAISGCLNLRVDNDLPVCNLPADTHYGNRLAQGLFYMTRQLNKKKALDCFAFALDDEANIHAFGLFMYQKFAEEAQAKHHIRKARHYFEREQFRFYLNDGDLIAARPLAEKFEQHPRPTAELYSMLGCYYLYAGQPQTARDKFEAGLQAYPASEDLKTNLTYVDAL